MIKHIAECGTACHVFCTLLCILSWSLEVVYLNTCTSHVLVQRAFGATVTNDTSEWQCAILL